MVARQKTSRQKTSRSDKPPKKKSSSTRVARGKSVFITGTNGFLGSRILQRLLSDPRYKRIVVLDIKSPPFSARNTKYYKVDLTEPTADATVADILKKEQCDTFIHLAFLANPTHRAAYAHELESIGTMNILHASAEAGVRKIVVSTTTMVYGAIPTNPNFLTEDRPLRGSSDIRYVKDRIEAEREIKAFRLKNPDIVMTVLRPCIILGPTIKNFITKFFGRPIVPTILGYDPLLQFVHEDDVIDVLKLTVDKDFSGEYNIVGKGVLPLSTVLKLSGRIGFPMIYSLAYPVFNGLWMAQIGDGPAAFFNYLRYLWIADGAKAAKEMGFEPKYSTKETLEQFAGVERLRRIRLTDD